MGWLNVTPATQSFAPNTQHTFLVLVSSKGLKPGTYNAQVIITDGSDSTPVNVTFTIKTPCTYTVSPSHLDFTVDSTKETNSTPPSGTVQSFTVTPNNCGVSDTAQITASSGQWFSVDTASVSLGGGAQVVNVTVSGNGLAAGTYTSSVKVGDQSVTVTLTVNAILTPSLPTPTP